MWPFADKSQWTITKRRVYEIADSLGWPRTKIVFHARKPAVRVLPSLPTMEVAGIIRGMYNPKLNVIDLWLTECDETVVAHEIFHAKYHQVVGDYILENLEALQAVPQVPLILLPIFCGHPLPLVAEVGMEICTNVMKDRELTDYTTKCWQTFDAAGAFNETLAEAFALRYMGQWAPVAQYFPRVGRALDLILSRARNLPAVLGVPDLVTRIPRYQRPEPGGSHDVPTTPAAPEQKPETTPTLQGEGAEVAPLLSDSPAHYLLRGLSRHHGDYRDSRSLRYRISVILTILFPMLFG